MIFKKLNNFAAPAQFDFTDPDTQHYYKANTRPELVNLILQYREQNQLAPIESLNLVLENYWCSQPQNNINCGNVELKRGLMGYIKGGMALLKNLAFQTFADQEVAEQRALICIKCPHNVFPDKDYFLKWSDEIAEASVGDRRVSVHEELGNCEVCSCIMKSKVFYKDKIKLPKEQADKLPSYCWQNTDHELNGK